MQVDLTEREKLDECLLAIALQSLEAGEALPEVESAARGAAAAVVPYKYGMHLPNWFNGDSPGLRQEVKATLPVSLTFLDNVKGEGLNPNVEILHARGVKPWLVFRPYFRPDDGINPAIVGGYAGGAVIRMRDDYFRYPLIRQAYDEGRFIVKLFNETNIGGEGFPRGRAGFAEALRAWKQARAVVKAAYPNAKIISLCNTPGNDDVWFTGDQQNVPYWYHGPEAAKASPSQADIGAAIVSCPFREMFELADYIGIHVYGNIRRTVDGDLATWYSRRHEQALKFLGPYIRAGKKLIINEWDLGYDDGQEYRAEAVVYGLEHIVGPNDAILFVNHWWNADKNEGALTWDKHRTREDGVFRPVVHAIKAFREGASTPLPPPSDPPSTPPPNPPTIPPATGDIQLPDWCRVDRAVATPGQQYWHLKRAYWQDFPESGGTHHIYALNPHDGAVTMLIKWDNTTDRVVLDKPAGEPAGNYPMFGAVYSAQLEGRGAALSDKVSGMKLPQNQHVNYLLEWELRTKEGEVPVPPTTPTKTLEDTAFEEMTEHQLRVTPTFALPSAIIRYNDQLGDNRKGFDFVTPELRFDYSGVRYAMMGAQHPVSEAKLVAYAKDGDWRNVQITVRLKTTQLEIPYQRQIKDVNVDYARGDCGPAVLTSYYKSKGVAVHVDTLSREADKIQNDGTPGFSGLTLKEMQQLAALRGTRLVRRDGMNKTDCLIEFASDNPFIALVNYEAMPEEHKYDKGGKVGGHYVLPVGMDGEWIIYHDPYWNDSRGAYRRMKYVDFDKAWMAASKNGNPQRCGLLFR